MKTAEGIVHVGNRNKSRHYVGITVGIGKPMKVICKLCNCVIKSVDHTNGGNTYFTVCDSCSTQKAKRCGTCKWFVEALEKPHDLCQWRPVKVPIAWIGPHDGMETYKNNGTDCECWEQTGEDVTEHLTKRKLGLLVKVFSEFWVKEWSGK